MKFIKKQKLQESMEELKENKSIVQEEVSKERTYERTGVEYAIDTVLNLNDDLYEKISHIVNDYGDSSKEELKAEEVDDILDVIVEGLDLSQEQREQIEQIIINDHYNPAAERKEEFEYDLKTIEDLFYENKLYSRLVRKKLAEFLKQMKEMGYTGLEK